MLSIYPNPKRLMFILTLGFRKFGFDFYFLFKKKKTSIHRLSKSMDSYFINSFENIDITMYRSIASITM